MHWDGDALVIRSEDKGAWKRKPPRQESTNDAREERVLNMAEAVGASVCRVVGNMGQAAFALERLGAGRSGQISQ